MNEKIKFPKDFCPFDPKKETMDEYEMRANFPIIIIGDGKINKAKMKNTKNAHPKDRGDSCLVGYLGD